MIDFNVIIYMHRKPTIGKVKKKLLYHVEEVDRCGFPKADIIMIVCSRKKPIANELADITPPTPVKKIDC